MGRLVIIGIGGVTCGGKTTITNKLHALFPTSKVLLQDDFYWPEESEHHVYDEYPDYANYDIMNAIDMGTMMNRVNEIKKEAEASQDTQLLLIEGILIFNDRELTSLFDKKYFLTLPKEECLKRRRSRDYLPPTPPLYFEKTAWPMYLKHKEEVKDVSDIVYISGMSDREEVFQRLHSDIEQLLIHGHS